MGFFSNKKEKRSIPDSDIEIITQQLMGITSFNDAKVIRDGNIRTAISVIANDVSNMKIQHFIGNQMQETNFDMLLNKRPNKIMDAKNFWFCIVASMLINGNSYAYITRKNGVPVELQFLPVTQLNTKLNDEGNAIEKYEYMGNGKTIDFSPQDILHFKTFSLDGITGNSPLLALLDDVNLIQHANKSLFSFYNRSIKGTGKVSIKSQGGTTIKNDTAKKIRQQFVDLNNPNSNEGQGIIIVDEQLYDYESIPLDSSFLNLLNNVEFSQKQIAKVFNLPIEKFGLESQHSSQTELNRQYLQSCLSSHLKVIESELSFKLLNGVGEFFFDTSTFSKPTFAELSNVLATLVEKGILSTDEARAELGYAPIKSPTTGGDNSE